MGFHSHQLNSLDQLKIDESRYLEKMSDASIIGICEAKHDRYTSSESRYLEKMSDASIIGISETKHDDYTSSNKIEI